MAKIEPGMEAMLDMYFYETNSLLEQLDEILLRTEQANAFESDDIKEIFRIMHTIKGSSAMMGFDNLSVLAHKAEDMFFVIRENPDVITDVSFVYDLVFQVSDSYKAQIEAIQNNIGGEYELMNFDELIDKLIKARDKLNSEASGDAEPAGAAPAAGGSGSAPAAPAGSDKVSVRVFFEDGCQMENLRAFLLINTIREECSFLQYYPEDVETNAESSKEIVEHGFLITFSANDDREYILKQIETALNVQSYEVVSGDEAKPAAAAPAAEAPKAEIPPEPVQELKTEKAAPAPAPAPKAAPKPAPSDQSIEKAQAAVSIANAQAANANGGSQKQSLISVNLAKLDALHDIVGEIITTESMVISNPDLEGLELESFNKAARDLKKLTGELQDTVMSIRMVPLAGVFQKMNRIVRDMRKKLNKDVEFVMEGEDTEVDKSIVDSLQDPIMHLVRNCMDHGIEDNVEDRLYAGKPEKGTLRLSAQNASGEVVITISDDGAGIDPDKIMEKAKRMGLLTKPESEYSEKEIQNLILLPGFSTNEQVTEFSGRGVGMDVVKANVEKCNGNIIVDSKKGVGTNFIIKIPLTLAIIDGMEITVGDLVFTVPISTIRESFKVEPDQILRDTGGNEMIMIRGICYPILRMHEKFGIETEVTELQDGILLLVETDNKSVCIFADRLIGEQQVVVKPFPKYLSRYNIKGEGLSGCTIMGDGSISLIIDTNTLIG
ncbi:MAG: chemotaxis protein CheA [Lachnospiraceae bacterium]|nr:chemotaxis protein CheA [Ruminococcus sp.]MCM1274794.1 chemotaxis protein CheA [Lachnospiraceae bacterium]